MKRIVVALLAVLAAAGAWHFRRRAEPAAPIAARPIDSARPPALAAPAALAAVPEPRSLASEIATRLVADAAVRADPAEREAFLQQAVQGVPRALYARLAEELATAAPGSVEADVLRAVVLRWAWEEPTNVAGWAVDHPDHPYRREALAIAAQRWARLNPEQLLQWASGLDDGDRRWVLLRSGDYLGRTDPALFSLWHAALPEGRDREQLELAVAREWAQRDPAALATELQRNLGPELAEWRRVGTAGLLTHLATLGGPEAAAFVATVPAGPLRDALVPGAVAAWAAQDPAAAGRWIDTLGATSVRAQAVQTLLGTWLDRDAEAAAAYARSLPRGSVSDQGNEAVAQYLAVREPATAIAWAEQIFDANRRAQTLAYVIGEWRARDPETLQELLRRRPELAAWGSGH
jgi:hypothetical protein